jgi:hypothetical protein
MADNVEVKLGADVSSAKSSVDDAASSIASSLAQMSKALENFTSTNQKMRDQAIANNADLSRSFLEMKASLTGGFNGIIGVVERFRGVLASLAAVLAGGFLWKSSVDEMLRMEDAVRGLTITFGMTTEQATQTAIALKLAGLSAETYEQMGQRVGRVLRTQSDEFDRLGVKTKDAQGNLLPMAEILQNIYKRMQDFKAGTDQTEFALSTVGRNAKDFASDMERLNSVTGRAAELQQQLGIEMGPERIAQIEAYRVEVNAFHVILGNIADRIGEAVLPQLMSLAGYFNSVGPQAAKIFVDAIRGMLTAIDYLVTGLQEWGVTFVAIWRMVAERSTRAWEEREIKILQIEADLHKRLATLWQEKIPGSDVGPGPLKSGSERFTTRPTGGDDTMLQLENRLRAKQSAYNNEKLAQGSFETWSLEMTRNFWENVLDTETLSAKQRLEVQNKFYEAERQVQQAAFAAYIGKLEDEKAALGHNIEAKIAIAQKEFDATAQRYGQESAQASVAYKKLVDLRQQLADQRERIAEIEDKQNQATLKHEIDLAKINADQAVALHQISAAQRLDIERDYINQEYAAEVDGLNKRIALLSQDPTADPVKLAELKAQLLKVEQDYQKQLTQIDNAAVLEREKYALQADDAIKNSMSELLSNLVANTKNWKQTLLDALKQLDEALVKIAANKLVEQMFGAGTAGGDFLKKITGGIFGSATDTAQVTATTTNTTALTALTTAVTANTAAVTAASTASAGGGLGDLFGGGGGGSSFFGDLLSLDVGTPYVPQDTLAVVHKGEAVVPAKYNRPGANLGGLVANMHFHLPGQIDGRTMDQIAASAASGVQRAAVRIR